MVPTKTRYPNIEKLALSLLVVLQKLKPYIQAYAIVVLINHPLSRVLHYPKMLGRLMRWSIKLSQYKICYLPRVTIKGQVMADVIIELTTNEEVKEPRILCPTIKRPLESLRPIPTTWTIFVDGSSNGNGCGWLWSLVPPNWSA